MESNFINLHGGQLHYLKLGNGPKALLCFHGYGQEASVFSPLSELLSERFTIFSFDLFYHGKSTWHSCETAICPQELVMFFKEWSKKENYSEVELCGFSMGGKIVLSLINFWDIKINKIWLLAPDGIRTNIWYLLATNLYLTRRLFHYTVHHPATYFRFLDIIKKLNIIDKGLTYIAKKQMSNLDRREKVYSTWLCYRKLSIDFRTSVRILNRKKIKCIVFTANHDPIIPPKMVESRINKIKDCEYYILNSRHHQLIKEASKLITDII